MFSDPGEARRTLVTTLVHYVRPECVRLCPLQPTLTEDHKEDLHRNGEVTTWCIKQVVADLRISKFDPVKMADITTLVQHHHAGALCSARVRWTMSLTVHTH